jgi:hypothetical protein
MSLAVKLKNLITGSIRNCLSLATQLAKKLLLLLESAPANSGYAKPDVIANAKKVANLAFY